jgi:hypothetical protein
MWITKTNFIAFISPNNITKKWHKQTLIQGDSRVIMSPTELKMQPTIHLKRKAGYGRCDIQLYLPNVLWVAFSIPSGSISLVKTLYNKNYHKELL